MKLCSHTEKELNLLKYNTEIELQCEFCENRFFKKVVEIKKDINRGRSTKYYCTRTCFCNARKISHKVYYCRQCKKPFQRALDKRCKQHFCSSSCSAIYNNTHKTKGYRRSKLEVWLEAELIRLYPNLEFHFNRKDTINSELDIYIPSLKLAFELNGIFHYEPIYGKEKLDQIKNNDTRKFQACLEHGVELCIINTSQFKTFKPKASQKYLDIISCIIDNKTLVAEGGS